MQQNELKEVTEQQLAMEAAFGISGSKKEKDAE